MAFRPRVLSLLLLASCDGRVPSAASSSEDAGSLPLDGTRVPVSVDLASEVYGSCSDCTGLDYFGYAVSSAGDIDADGYDDLLVTAPAKDDGSIGQAGAVYVYYGSAAGIDLGSEQKLALASPASADYFGASARGAGDLDGDGYDDVVVGVPGAGSGNEGAAYVYYGSTAGLGGETLITASDAAAGDQFGVSVAGAGDIDADGYADLIIGAHTVDDAGTDAGAVYAYLGSAGGVSTASETKLVGSDTAAGDDFGIAVDAAGDFNGDGYSDVVVGAPGQDGAAVDDGAAYVFLGGSSGLSSALETKIVAADPLTQSGFGTSVGQAGDVDGDGIDDVIVGAYAADGITAASGAAYVVYGTAAGTPSQQKLSALDGATSDAYGYSVRGGADIDADGYDDVLVGAPLDDGNSGAVYAYYGSAAGAVEEQRITATFRLAKSQYGFSVSPAGDLDADGSADIVVGAYRANEGYGYVYSGDCRDDDADGVCIADDCDDGDGSESTDTDGDGVCDGDDLCDGADASGDSDGDGICDDSDACFGDNATGDTDGDGVCDDLDACTGDDATGDSDFDGVCDDRDLCFGDDASGDADGDGWCGESVDGSASDCEDGVASVNPGAAEVCDGYDTDCDGGVAPDELDRDGDGVPECAGDCDDADPAVAPGLTETCDGLDNDCDGVPSDKEVDADGDGVLACDGDCDDSEPAVGAGLPEICGDGLDNDCDGLVDKADPQCGPLDDQGGGCAVVPGGSGALALAGLVVLGSLRRRKS